MATFLVFFCLFSLLSVGFGQSPNCPKEDLSPCSCKELAFGIHVVCANFNSSRVLERSLKALKDLKVYNVLLHALYIEEELPNTIFDGLQIKEIRVESSRLHFSEPAFSGLDSSLNVVNVRKSVIMSEKQFSLARLPKLTEFYVKEYSLKTLQDCWLNEKIPNVTAVELDNNDITDMEENVFANLSSLKRISLADNRIKVVKRSMFPRPAFQLIRIDLSFNEIYALPVDFFKDMPSLKEIILSNNEIKNLPETTWSPVWQQLTQVLLFDNQLECGDDVKWIKEYSKPYQLDGICVLPKNMSGRSVRDIYKT